MATVFWNSQGIISIDYLQKGQTITGASHRVLFHIRSGDSDQSVALWHELWGHA